MELLVSWLLVGLLERFVLSLVEMSRLMVERLVLSRFVMSLFEMSRLMVERFLKVLIMERFLVNR